jgi:hypothetical protein
VGAVTSAIACLAVLMFWMVRVRLTGWYGRQGAIQVVT